ncbi:MAG: ATP synthase F1 subunit epsilon [Alphaproteobacteria bacterium]|nr:ATP synthase F1 subunit epsilon [Alphaproteobacteria bacterium]MCD8520466.1 ATP synthase F1 subunit epsilon [Alphaproteobacteria bacterium]MCD8571159.1 ATP synthase F1 subunit epsilon [Alphaproteobacteria bacterium]
MTDNLLNFELVSPEARLVSEPVKMAVIPGEEGVMGVGVGHASFVVTLKPGVVGLFAEGQDFTKDIPARRIFIAGGFADISEAGCSILAEEAVDVVTFDAAKLEQELSNLNEDLGIAQEETDKARIQAKIAMTTLKLQAVAA